ncbi:T9SS type A sorting domain-containing protein [Arcicella sp. DC2W]|uniref:T9SS type A sorting domain-containing protein n=1 Tax=Arcicella gelida TaxID=2984195 RepID=A0ABU5S602_9BACT|nr:T9SS type A sorting domain-containing protein [Arcicella sp. DC2W]MEA5403862.1 T9SS type A sorting domain-containing protein [Arcicella sp. DC2W]
MLQKLQLSLLLMFFTFVSQGQSLEILAVNGQTYSYNVCLGQQATIQYRSTLNFSLGNNFKVQVGRSDGSWTEVSAVDSSGYLLATLPTELSVIYPELNPSVSLRIVSTAPAASSSNYSLTLNTLPSLAITGVSKNIIYPFEEVSLSLIAKGSRPITIFSSDSTTISYYDYSTGSSDNALGINPSKAGNYRFLNVSNMCGVGKTTGSVDFTVLENKITITGVPAIDVCRNGNLEVYATKTGKWASDEKFYIRLINGSNRAFDFEATENNGVFSTKVNSELLLGAYRLQVIAKKLGVISNSFNYTINVHEEPSAEVTAVSSTVNFAERTNLLLMFKGFGKYKVQLNNGTIIENFAFNEENPSYIELFPQKTSEYYVQSFSSTCGNGSGKTKVKITVLDGIRTDSLKSGQFCTGATCEVKFLTNADLPVGSKVKIKLYNVYEFGDGADIYTGKFVEVIGTVIKDKTASFIIAPNIFGTLFKNKVFATVYTDNLPNTSQSPNFINVILPAQTEIYPATNEITLDTPQTINLPINVFGGVPFKMVLSDSTIYEANNFLGTPTQFLSSFVEVPVYVDKSKTFKVNSVTNVCGTYSTHVGSFNVSIKNPNKSVRLQSTFAVNGVVCVGETHTINLSTSNDFSSEQLFTVRLFNQNKEEVSDLGSVKRGMSKIVIPSSLASGVYTISVKSNNSNVTSNSIQFFVKAKAKISLASPYEQVLEGELVGFEATLEDAYGQNEIVFTDGSKTIFDIQDRYTRLTFKKILTNSNPFGISSIINQCGAGTVLSKDITITVQPFRLNIPTPQVTVNSYCTNTLISIPFEIFAKTDVKQNLSIQIAKENQLSFTTLNSNIKASPATALLPSNLTAGKYKVRIISNDNKVQSNEFVISIADTPKATLQLNEGEVNIMTINAGESIILKVNDENPANGIFSYVIQDNKYNKIVQSQRDNGFSYYLYPMESKEYKLVYAENKCGAGQTSGTVKVTVKPVLNMVIAGNTDNRYCLGTTLNAAFASKGTFEADNVFRVYVLDGNNEKIELLKSTSNGNFRIPFGNTLKRGNYKLLFESTNPAIVKEISNIVITDKADVSISGGAIVNAGTFVQLVLKNNSATSSPSSNTELLNYQLSNGVKGTIGGFSNDGLARISVFVNATETFTIKSISNICGEGNSSGTAIIKVNAPSEKQVIYQGAFQNICRGSEPSIFFTTRGTFSTSNTFTVQLSDKTGQNFKNLATEGTQSPLKVKIPIDALLGDGFLMRVLASDNDATSTTNTSPISIYDGITARFDTSTYYINEIKPVTLTVKLQGELPITFFMGTDEINLKQFTATSYDFPITVDPSSANAYKIYSINNQVCPSGTILSPSTARIELITGTDELGKMGINIFPNPTSDVLNIESDGKELDVQLINFVGKVVQEQILKGEQKQIDLSRVPSGTYFLHIQKDGRQATFKVLKQ